MNQQMSKEEKLKVPETVTVHTLSLKPLPFSGSRFVEFQADFSPRKNSESSSVSTLPSYNSDGKHFTPAFYLSSELNQEQHWQQNFFRNFENKKNQSTTQNKHLLQPKPESRYCQVCHQYFQDYIKHTKHSVHLKKLREGSIQNEITRLIQYFKNSDKSVKRSSPITQNLLTKNSQDFDESQMEQGEKSRKMIKISKVEQESKQICSAIGSLNHLVIGQSDGQISQL